MARQCAGCGADRPMIEVERWKKIAGGVFCPKCASSAVEQKDKDLEAAESVLVTTTGGVDGYRVTRYHGIESVELVIGTGLFVEVAGDFKDFFGKRSLGFEKKLTEAKQTAMKTLQFQAARLGGNAVIGVDLDYTEFSGNRVALIVNGTVVTIEPVS